MSDFRYGDNKTIHRTRHIDVETDEAGNVVSVWFRCMSLPFKQVTVSDTRAEDMKRMYSESEVKLNAVVLEDIVR